MAKFNRGNGYFGPIIRVDLTNFAPQIKVVAFDDLYDDEVTLHQNGYVANRGGDNIFVCVTMLAGRYARPVGINVDADGWDWERKGEPDSD